MSKQFFKNGFSQSNHFFNIVITFQVLWRIDFGRKSRISGRGYRVEGRGVGVFIHLLILFLGGRANSDGG